MEFEFEFEEEAWEELVRLRDDSEHQHIYRAIWEVILQLEVDPGDPKLGTRTFAGIEDIGFARTTPVRKVDWVIVWHLDDTQPVVAYIKNVAG